MKIKRSNKMTTQCNPLQVFLKKFFNCTMCALIAAALLFLPFTFNIADFSIESTLAFAKSGKGGGNSDGHGGGRSGGHRDSRRGDHDGGKGSGHGDKGKSKDHDKDKKKERNGTHYSGKGNDYRHDPSLDRLTKKISSLLGRLNAAHASPTARLNASPNSAVGKVAIYEKDAIAFQEAKDHYRELSKMLERLNGLVDPTDDQLARITALERRVRIAKKESIAAHQAAAASLAEASNKPVDHRVAQAVNDLLGIDVDVPIHRPEYRPEILPSR